ncbi:MAG: Cell shape determining protein MreB [Parcubacteria group bacterium GW2011_GWD2_38_12]|nr:MAG: Cell shape determining protein MreB [Parcubacteria group bacterium GW2011_GWD2_38_12]
MAEDIKISIGSAYELSEPIETIMRGRDLVSGLPKEVVVDDREIRQVLDKSLKILVDTVKSAIEEAPPELVADIMHNGIVLAGGGSLLRGLDKRIAEETLMPVRVCEDPLTAVVRGAGIILEDIEKVRDMIANTGL